MTPEIMAWAARNRVSHQALMELRAIFGTVPLETSTYGLKFSDTIGHSESNVQSRVRLEAAKVGAKLWRNNVGVLLDERGTPVRYGLANDSKRLNENLKSGDLIGWRRFQVLPEHVGTIVAQFVSRECKPEGWHYTATEREKAQLAWINLIVADGGDAKFVTGEGTL